MSLLSKFSKDFFAQFRSPAEKTSDKKWEDHKAGHPGGGGGPQLCDFCATELEMTDRWKGLRR